MTSSVPEMHEIGEESDPRITQIFTDWGEEEGWERSLGVFGHSPKPELENEVSR